MKKLITLSLSLIFFISLHAQVIQGDGLIDIVGSRLSDPAVEHFLSIYELKNTTDSKYSSFKYGIDISVRNDTIIDMSIYQNNSLYGNYTNNLPKGIKFGCSSADVIKKLGKPSTLYSNSGYAEYMFGKYIMSYWFEEEKLSPVTILLK